MGAALSRYSGMAVGLALLAGCVTQPSEPASPAQPAASSTTTTAAPPPDILLNETRIGVLPARELLPGECGMFLFTPRPTPRFVFYANAARSMAEMQVEGQPAALTLTLNDGTALGQFFSETTYVSPTLGLSAEVVIKDARPVEGGYEIGAGSIQLLNSEGWTVVIPVAGATTCEPGA